MKGSLGAMKVERSTGAGRNRPVAWTGWAAATVTPVSPPWQFRP